MIYAAILKNEVAWFDEEENNSSLVAARLAMDAADVKSAIAERISVILQNMTSLLTSFIVGFIVEWRVSLLILATFPLLVLANFAQVNFSCFFCPQLDGNIYQTTLGGFLLRSIC